MMQFPIRIPKSRVLSITQPFKGTMLVDYYKAQGLNIDAHTGVDVVCGNNFETYGAAVVCPFPVGKHVRSRFVEPMNDKGNSIAIGYESPDGKKYELLFAHLSGIERSYPYEYGETIGYIGNSGLVLPRPTPANPFGGTHLHLELRINGSLVDPLHHFDIRAPFRGLDTPLERDIPPISWALSILRANLSALINKK